MTRRKERLTVTVDAEAIEAGNEAVEAGRADSLSGWVNLAMTERAAREKRLAAMREALDAYERAHGVISDAELLAQERTDRRSAVLAPRKSRASRPKRRGAA